MKIVLEHKEFGKISFDGQKVTVENDSIESVINKLLKTTGSLPNFGLFLDLTPADIANSLAAAMARPCGYTSSAARCQ